MWTDSYLKRIKTSLVDKISLIIHVKPSVMNFETQFRTNQECFTQRTSDLEIDSEPDIKCFNIWHVHDIDDHLEIWFSSVRLQCKNSYQ